MEETLRNAGEKAMELAEKQGVEAEVFLLCNKEFGVDLTGGKIETLKEAKQIGMGVRVIRQSKLGFAYTSDLSDPAIEEVVNNAVRISAYTTADKYHRLPDPASVYPEVEACDPSLVTTPLIRKVELAKQIERIARAKDPRIKLVERTGYEDTAYSNLVMNTRGLYAYDQGSFCGIYISLVAEEDGDAQNGYSTMINKNISALNPSQVGEEAAERALRTLNARPIPSGKMMCIMEPQVVTRFLSLISQSIEADMVMKGKSMFEGKVGEKVASSVVNLVDDALHPEGIASFPFDGEGVPSQKTSVITEGYLNGFLYDFYCAQKEGKSSTGNGQRGSFRSLPSVGCSNFILQPGNQSPKELLTQVSHGLYITDVMGMHTANPISGDFSVGASGLMIENGFLSFPVRGITIAGNLMQLLKDIEAVGNDLRFFGSRAASTVLLKCLSIGGE